MGAASRPVVVDGWEVAGAARAPDLAEGGAREDRVSAGLAGPSATLGAAARGRAG